MTFFDIWSRFRSWSAHSPASKDAAHDPGQPPFPSYHPWFDGYQDFISAGSTASVWLTPNGHARKVVRTTPVHPDIQAQNLEGVDIEHDIYQLLGSHPRLLKFVEYNPNDGLTLEYMPNGTLRHYLCNAGQYIDLELRRTWVSDAVEAVGFLHSKGVIHGDIKPENFLLDSRFRLRIMDFAGSWTAGRLGYACEKTKFFLPRGMDDPATVATIHSDLFALGSTLYEIVTGHQPCEDKEDDEVEKLYELQQFPETDDLLCGTIIRKLWRTEFATAEQVSACLLTTMP